MSSEQLEAERIRELAHAVSNGERFLAPDVVPALLAYAELLDAASSQPAAPRVVSDEYVSALTEKLMSLHKVGLQTYHVREALRSVGSAPVFVSDDYAQTLFGLLTDKVEYVEDLSWEHMRAALESIATQQPEFDGTSNPHEPEHEMPAQPSVPVDELKLILQAWRDHCNTPGSVDDPQNFIAASGAMTRLDQLIAAHDGKGK